jgi:hypothetical protein
MDHNLVVRNKMTERYLLDELDPQEREQFEEHFFVCEECALDVRAGAELVVQSRAILAETPEPAFAAARRPKPVWEWLRWFRPAFAIPVMAALLVVVGYQNLVTVPKLQSELRQPQVLPWASINVGTWGAGGPAISVRQGQGFLLFVRIPSDGSYSRYIAELYRPDGRVESTITIPANLQQDQWPVQIPAGDRAAGSYTLRVRGINAAGESEEVGKASFELQVQK